MADRTAYWVRGAALFRSHLPRNGVDSRTERWNGDEWLDHPDLLRMMLNGEPSLDEVTKTEAKSRFPAAF